ncbi:MAG: DNA topoisomerase VI subunit B, partial [Methanoregulaceae archaeon]|nr:DNA topoisomerase VI subunit B [Methanoregulaceae archaeon]
ARTRPVSVHSGHPFIVEAALCYGGRLAPEGNAQILRFANRVPLMYQQGACAITGSILEVNWKTYGIAQQGLPIGPLLILVHVASTNVPFTSESKDAIAAIPEIMREIMLALQELGRELKTWLSRREKNRVQDNRARAVCAILPEIAGKVSEIVELPVPDVSIIEGRIMRKLIVKRWSEEGKVTIELANYSGMTGEVSVYLISGDPANDAVPPPDYSEELGGEYTKVWKVPVNPGKSWKTTFSGHGGGSLSLRGVEEGALIMVDLDV